MNLAIDRRSWRPRRGDEVLPALSTAVGIRPGSQRCLAIDLKEGDCQQPNLRGKAYCYYHDKVYTGLMEPTSQYLYPVFPLPETGYVTVENGARGAA